MLWKLVGTSNAVSSLPTEGQFLPELEPVMRQDPWNAEVSMPWPRIKQVWDTYWDQEKPLLLEKSPTNILRTDEISAHFSPAYFLLMVRNPYAHCEGLIRRNQWNAKQAAEFTVRCMRQQAKNKDSLKNTFCFTYEQLTAETEMISRKIESFIPKLGKLQSEQSFKVHSIDGSVKRKIVDLNEKKIFSLSMTELKQINEVLCANTDAMNYWGYELYQPSLAHRLSRLKANSVQKQLVALFNVRQSTTRLLKRLNGKYAR